MGHAWITLSTKWSLSSCQAALNVVISVVGTVAIWAFGRFFWQRGCSQVIDNDKKQFVRLPKLLTVASPGESWDLVVVQRRKVFARDNWHLLLQVIVIVIVSIGLMLSGPIAQGSLRTGQSKFPRDIEVLQATKGGGYFANLLDANVLWNETMKSLEDADFPTTQMLDYLPTSTKPWVYNPREWNPTWVVSCNNTPVTPLPEVFGSGNGSFYEPFEAFPRFRDTYPDQTWLTDAYRVETNFDWWSNWNLEKQFERVFFFVIVQSDPMIDDRAFTNQGALRISITCFDATNFTVSTPDDVQNSGEESWKPLGLVDRVTYTRTECEISRNPGKIVENEEMVPWIWTNNTYSIAMGYRTFWQYALEATVGRDIEPRVLDAATLFRYYQAYMVNTNTNHALPSKRKVTIWVDTVELSVTFLTIVLILALATVVSSLRYFVFLARNHKDIGDICVPDGKLGWMIHAARVAEPEDEANEGNGRKKDREYFQEGLFGQIWDILETPRSASEKRFRTAPDGAGQDLESAIPPTERVLTAASMTSEGNKSPRRLARVSTAGSMGGRSASLGSDISTHSRKESHSTIKNEPKRLSSVAEGSTPGIDLLEPPKACFSGHWLDDGHTPSSQRFSSQPSSVEGVSPLDLPSRGASLLESELPPSESGAASTSSTRAEDLPTLSVSVTAEDEAAGAR